MKKLSGYFLTAILLLVCALSFAACGGNGGNDIHTDEWGEWVITASAGCEAEGEQTRINKVNGAVERLSIAPTGHDWDEWELTAQPSCLVAGTETRACNTCGNNDVRPLDALDHDWDEWEITAEPSCLVAGSQKRVCLHDNNHTESQPVAALGHAYSEWVIDTAPSCTAPGIEITLCTNDNGHTDIRQIPAYGHAWGEWVITTAPTCDTDGVETRTCINDGGHTETRVINAYGHDWTDWVILTPVTESTDGEEMRICKNNKTHKETHVLYATGTVGLRYNANNYGTEYALNGFEDGVKQDSIIIPLYHNDKPVTNIYSNAFRSSELKSVTFLDGSMVQRIGNGAFSYCTELTTIDLPDSVKTIDAMVFRDSALKSIKIGKGVNIIRTWTFLNCVNLTDVTFAKDSQLERIARRTFEYCVSLKSIEIPASVTNIGGDAFAYCEALASITVASDNSKYKSEGNCIIEIATNTLIAGCKSSVIPNYVTTIGPDAFRDCIGLESIEIPASVISIAVSAFSNCTSLTDIDIPESVTTMGNSVFSGWTDTQTIYIKGFFSEAEADAVWGDLWRSNCNATIIYQGTAIG